MKSLLILGTYILQQWETLQNSHMVWVAQEVLWSKTLVLMLQNALQLCFFQALDSLLMTKEYNYYSLANLTGFISHIASSQDLQDFTSIPGHKININFWALELSRRTLFKQLRSTQSWMQLIDSCIKRSMRKINRATMMFLCL